jgi:hypothetical protein
MLMRGLITAGLQYHAPSAGCCVLLGHAAVVAVEELLLLNWTSPMVAAYLSQQNNLLAGVCHAHHTIRIAVSVDYCVLLNVALNRTILLLLMLQQHLVVVVNTRVGSGSQPLSAKTGGC